MISTGELKKGVAIELDGELWQILDYHHIKMGRGSAQVRITLRNIKRGQTVERSFQAGTKWPRASMEKRPVQFLYRDGDDFHFMDTDTYDQFHLTAEQLGESAQYLKDGMSIDRTSYQGETIGVELPVTVDLKVVDTEPGFAGDTQSGARKPATTETGLVVAGPDLRRARRHHPHRHADRRVPDPGLIGTRATPSRPTGRCRAGRERDPTKCGSRSRRRAVRRPHPRRQRGHPGRPGRRPPGPATRRPVGRGRDRAGHGVDRRSCLLRLKDERNQLQCVWFRDDRQRSAFEAQAGLRVVVHGRIDLYEPTGALQLYVDSMQPAGFGDLALRFEALKARLTAEGLFDAARKRPLPHRPTTIAVVTSPTGAVWRDVVHGARPAAGRSCGSSWSRRGCRATTRRQASSRRLAGSRAGRSAASRRAGPRTRPP